MKFTVTFKTPDAVCDTVNRLKLDHQEQEETAMFAWRWVEYGECVRIEFDTEKGTATVLEARS